VRDIQTFFKYLKKVSYLQFEMLNDICIIDNPSKPKRFNVSYILSSIKKNNRFFLKTSTQSALPSVSIFYKSANWIEREC
jgi:NADH-quinone oxidoreductase subunit C